MATEIALGKVARSQIDKVIWDYLQVNAKAQIGVGVRRLIWDKVFWENAIWRNIQFPVYRDLSSL